MKSIANIFGIGVMIVSILTFNMGCSDTSKDKMAGEKVTDIKIGVLPLVSALPIFVADGEGYFEKEGLNVELVTFNSALEQNAALQAGEIDGYFSDPVNTIVMINGGVDVSIINTPYKANSKNRMFAILVSPQSKIDNIEGLKGVKVAISNATIIEYLQDKMLEHYGFTEDEIASQEIKQIPIRMQLLLSGTIEAALLPEPLVSLAEYNGARVIVDDTVLDLPETVVAISNVLLERDPTLKDRYLNALESAVSKINSDSANLGDVLLAKINIPKEIKSSYKIPEFPVKAFPSEVEINQIQEWLIKKAIIKEKLLQERILK